ncbi:MAG TPA: hypothetical protein VMV51_08435 [Gemmatimonadaceae bacterium]|nr:hypothetical protein [Gemmatimonadaceae bacterium]
MTPVDTTDWTRIGASDNADFFEVEPGILAVVPREGTDDNAHTARQSIAIQLDHLRARGAPAGIVVFMDPVVEQDAGARTVYREAPDPELQRCFALVGSSAFGRAVASVFLGLSRPRVPTRMFATFDDAVAWIRERLA